MALMQSLKHAGVRKRNCTLAEYEDDVKKAGFGQVQGFRTPSPLDLILAIKG